MVVKHQVGGTGDDDWSLKIKNKKTQMGTKSFACDVTLPIDNRRY